MTNYRKSLIEAYQEVKERELTPKELKDREKIAKKLPIKDFEKRYGKEKGMQVKMATATNMAKAKSNESFKSKKEELNEDGHSDVPSAIRKCKTMIEDANEIMTKLNTMGMEDSLPSWWTNKLAIASNNMNKLRDYILNPIQENVIQEAPGDLEDMKKIVSELEKASKMHLGQSKRVAAHIGMMEGDATDAAKEIIDREKERMKDKHDRIMQRAKIRDVTDASRERQGEN